MRKSLIASILFLVACNLFAYTKLGDNLYSCKVGTEDKVYFTANLGEEVYTWGMISTEENTALASDVKSMMINEGKNFCFTRVDDYLVINVYFEKLNRFCSYIKKNK